jgi:hypothetical protein
MTIHNKGERTVAKAAVKSLIDAGFELSVYTGAGEYARGIDSAKILRKMGAVDTEHLYVYKEGVRIGWVFFVYGNDPWETINDYTVNLEEWIGPDSKVYEVEQQLEEKAS